MVAARLAGAQPIRMNSPDTQSLDRPMPLRLALLMSVPGFLALVVYWPTLQYGFVFDDLSLISDDGPVRLGTTWMAYRPLRHVSYLLDYSLGGGGPWMYHLSNLALHGANGVLVTMLVVRLGAGLGAAIAGGMLFVSHPLGAEAAAYVAGRRDLLALFFSLSGILLWTSARSRPWRGALALLVIVAATLSKETGLVTVALCAIASLCGFGPRLAAAAAPLLVTMGVSVSAVLLYGAVGPWLVTSDPVALTRIAGSLSAHYAASLVIPVRLAIEYPELVCSGIECANLAGLSARLGIALLVALVTVSVALLVGTRGGRAIARGTAFATSCVAVLFVTLAFSVGAHEPGADRHAYPLVALFSVALALVCDEWFSTSHGGITRRVALTAALIIVAMGVRVTEARITVWESPWTLWGSAVGRAHVSARAHHNLGRLLAGEGAYRHARRHFRAALRMDHAFSPSMVALAAIECERGRYRRALHGFNKARASGAVDADLAPVEQACVSQRNAG